MGYADKLKKNSSKIQPSEKVLDESIVDIFDKILA